MTEQPRDDHGRFISANDTQQPATRPTANAGASGGNLRALLATYLGDTEYEERDTYETFGWPRSPEPEQFYAQYLRNPFARPIVDRPAFTSWRDPPEFVDDGTDSETQFEKDIEKADRALDIWSYAQRLDRLAGIGRYGLLVFVTSDIEDTDDLAEPIPDEIPGDGLDKVNQIKVFSEISVDDVDTGGIEAAEEGRWGKPVRYSVDFSSETSNDDGEDDSVYDVHHSRTIAAPAQRLLDDEQFARSRLEIAINILLDIEKTLGSIAELAYRGADKGLAVNFDPEKVDTSGQSWDDLNEELQDWEHGLQPLLRLVGADDVTQLGGEVADASGIFEPQLSALSTATHIPKRVFEGDPAGALASAAEDTQAYFGFIKERRQEYNTPHYARPIAEWLEDHGVIAEPVCEYPDVNWSPLRVLSEKENAEIGKKAANAAGEAIVVKEIREMFNLTPQPDWMSDDIANAYLSEMAGGSSSPGASIDQALAQNRADAEASARTEARIQRGSEADD